MCTFEQQREKTKAQNQDHLLNYLESETGRWHDGAGENISLREYLGLTKQEYQVFVITPSLLKLS